MTPSVREYSALRAWLATLAPYQARWVYSPHRFHVIVKPRQVGYSHATAAAAVRAGLMRQRSQLILSASQSLSDEVLDKAVRHCEVLASFGLRAATDWTLCNRTEIAWRTGGRVIALPANPRTARGFAGDCYLDEAAYMQDLDKIADAVLPMVSRGDYCLKVLSTPNGMAGTFADWVHNPPRGWHVETVTLDDVVRAGFPVDRDKLWQLCGGDERLFGQWFMGAFLDADLQYLPTELIDAALAPGLPAWPKWEYPHWEDRPPWETYAGLDVGRHHDRTALVVVRTLRGVAYVERIETLKRTAFRDQRAMLDRLRKEYVWDRLHVDSTGMGEQLAEELVEAWGGEVVPVKFTNPDKADLATRTLRWLVNGKVRLPRDGTADGLRKEMVALRRKVTDAGAIQYEIPRTNAGHGDMYWAFALALKGAGEPVSDHGLGQEPVVG